MGAQLCPVLRDQTPMSRTGMKTATRQRHGEDREDDLPAAGQGTRAVASWRETPALTAHGVAGGAQGGSPGVADRDLGSPGHTADQTRSPRRPCRTRARCAEQLPRSAAAPGGSPAGSAGSRPEPARDFYEEVHLTRRAPPPASQDRRQPGAAKASEATFVRRADRGRQRKPAAVDPATREDIRRTGRRAAGHPGQRRRRSGATVESRKLRWCNRQRPRPSPSTAVDSENATPEDRGAAAARIQAQMVATDLRYHEGAPWGLMERALDAERYRPLPQHRRRGIQGEHLERQALHGGDGAPAIQVRVRVRPGSSGGEGQEDGDYEEPVGYRHPLQREGGPWPVAAQDPRTARRPPWMRRPASTGRSRPSTSRAEGQDPDAEDQGPAGPSSSAEAIPPAADGTEAEQKRRCATSPGTGGAASGC